MKVCLGKISEDWSRKSEGGRRVVKLQKPLDTKKDQTVF